MRDLSPRLLKYYNHIFRKKSSISPRYGYKFYKNYEKAIPFPPLWTNFLWKINMKTVRFHGKRDLKFKMPRLHYPIRMNCFAWMADLYIYLPRRRPLALMLSVYGTFFYMPLIEKLTTYSLIALGVVRSFTGNFISPRLGGFLLFAPNVSKLSCIAIGTYKEAQYVLSRGSRGFIVAHDFLHYSVLICLPSATRKLLSFWDVGLFSNLYRFKPPRFFDCKIGFKRNLGYKIRVRGIAKNPVDHPHGGRTNSIAHPRSPWGWSTKIR